MATIRLGIDSTLAVKGGRQYEQASKRVVRSSRDMGRQLGRSDKALRQSGSSFGTLAGSVARLGRTLGVGLSVVAIGRFSKSIVNAASDVTELQNLVSVSFGDMARETRQWAAETAEAVGRSRFALLENAAALQAQISPMLKNRELAAEYSTQLGQLAVDLGSFFNIADTQALTRLQSGIAGEAEAVRRLGIDLSAAAIERELFNQGVRGGIKAATEANKIQARVAIILRQTSDAQGDAERTAGDYENQTKNLSGAWRDFTVQLGEFLVGPATGIVAWLADVLRETPKVIQSMGSLADEAKKLTEAGRQRATDNAGTVNPLFAPGGLFDFGSNTQLLPDIDRLIAAYDKLVERQNSVRRGRLLAQRGAEPISPFGDLEFRPETIRDFDLPTSKPKAFAEAFSPVLVSIRKTNNALDNINDFEFTALVDNRFVAAAGTLDLYGKAANTLVDEIKLTDDQLIKLGKTSELAQRAINDARTPVEAITDELELYREALDLARIAGDEVAQGRLTSALSVTATELNRAKLEAVGLSGSLLGMVDPAQQGADALAQLVALFASGDLGIAGFTQGVADAADNMTALVNGTKDVTAALDRSNVRMIEAGDIGVEFTTGLARGLASSVTQADSLGSAFRQLGLQVTDLVAQMLILQTLKAALGATPFGGFLGLTGNATGGDHRVVSSGGVGGLARAQSGLDRRVGGSGGTDSQLVAFRATPGEFVHVRTPAQERRGIVSDGQRMAPSVGSPVVTVNTPITITTDSRTQATAEQQPDGSIQIRAFVRDEMEREFSNRGAATRALEATTNVGRTGGVR